MSNSVKYINIPYNLLIMEDEPFILKNLHDNMQSTLGEMYSKAIEPKADVHTLPKIKIEPALQQVDNLQDAEKIVYSGACDCLITDFKVKETPHSKKDTADCLNLLRDMKKKLPFIPVIGHSAYRNLLDSAEEDSLTLCTFSKKDADSIQKCINMGKDMSYSINNYKEDITLAFTYLKSSINSKSIFEKQDAIENSRLIFSEIKIPNWAPYDYYRAIATLEPILYRISSVPSESLKIKSISKEFIDIIEPLIDNIKKPNFSFKNHGIPVFLNLEAKGYNVFMRK